MSAKTVDGMLCTSCRKPKAQLKQKKSKVLPGVQMYLCQSCMSNKYEPRGFIVLAGREHGIAHVTYWIKPKRYVGEPITVSELA